MQELIVGAAGEPIDVVAEIAAELGLVLQQKRERIGWILQSVEGAFFHEIAPALLDLNVRKGIPSATALVGLDAEHAELTPEDENILYRFWERISSERMLE
jgi:hypothetical protein